MEMSEAFTTVFQRQCGRNTRDLLYKGKKGIVIKPTSSPAESRGLLAGGGGGGGGGGGLLDLKSKSPIFPRAGGGRGRGSKLLVYYVYDTY